MGTFEFHVEHEQGQASNKVKILNVMFLEVIQLYVIYINIPLIQLNPFKGFQGFDSSKWRFPQMSKHMKRLTTFQRNLDTCLLDFYLQYMN